jgi:hypothetical protein
MTWRGWLLIAIVVACAATAILLPRIPQDEAYHHFADQRTILGIPNFFDVMSNIFFLIVGCMGLSFVVSTPAAPRGQFANSAERSGYLVFFLAVALTAFGSGYYHLRPGDARLVWDRLPMALGFMSLIAAILAERVGAMMGARLHVPLLVFGAGSVLYWNVTQLRGAGDLRPYAVVQFGSLLIILALLAFFPAKFTRSYDLLISFGFYGVAKIFEVADRQIFSVTHATSGHTLKHVAAALSAFWILRMLRLRSPLTMDVNRVANSFRAGVLS